jgi:3-methyladenine DNA glycosylase AlkD
MRGGSCPRPRCLVELNPVIPGADIPMDKPRRAFNLRPMRRGSPRVKSVRGGAGGDGRQHLPPSVNETARRIQFWLRERRNEQRARGVEQYFKHEVVSLGLPTPMLRAFAREQAGVLVRVWGLDEATALCDRLLQKPELEVRGMGILILGAFKRQFDPRLTRAGRRWLGTRLDNWALVDSFCGSVLSPLLDRHPAVERTLRRWSRARSLWVRRAALVSLVPFARRGRLLDTAYELALEHFDDPEDLMHKATGWVLREAGKTDRSRLREFLRQHGPALPRTALRYAIEHFPEPERQRLLASTRPATRLPA